MSAPEEFHETPRGQLLQQDEPVVGTPEPFDATPRGQLLGEGTSFEPVLFRTDEGVEHLARSVGEVNRLRMSRGYTEVDETPAAPVDLSFHPGDSGVTVDDVVAYVTAHPDDAKRVLDEERAGKNRSTVFERLGE